MFAGIHASPPSTFNSQAVAIGTSGNIIGFYKPTASVGFLDVGDPNSTIDP